MAGSYNHCVNHEGKLLDPESLNDMLENGGDVYEAVEEMYGMIWYLADTLECEGYHAAKDWVATARVQYTAGLKASPGKVEA